MRLSAYLLALSLVAVPALANDTTAQLGAGGLVFVNSQNIEMASEHLFVSPSQIKVVYEFNNTSSEDQHVLVAFPMPDVEGGPDTMIDVPSSRAEGQDPSNLFGFETSFNGTPVAASLYQYAFRNNVDYSADLKAANIPLAPFGAETQTALNALPEVDLAKLSHLGLVDIMEYDAGNGPQVDHTPAWTLRSTYTWEATFPPGVSEVIHTYTPSVGGTVATTFMPQDGDAESEARFAEYQQRYCVDDNLVASLEKAAIPADGYTNYPYVESWLSYIWSTGNNWAGPIGKFTLTVDKEDPDALASFCGENVKKTGATTFEMTATDWSPPYDQELEILLLRPVDWYNQ